MILIVNACTKDVANSDTATLEVRSELTPIQMVQLFEPISDGVFESRRTFTKEDAVLGVEALLNYQYGDFSVPCDERYRLTDTISVTKPNGVIGDDVVREIYEEVLHEMECHYASIDGQKKELFVDLDVVGETSTAVQIGFTNVFGTVAGIPSNTKTFVPGDDYNAIIGRCDDPNYPKNAPIKIADYTNWNLVGQYSNQVGTWYSDFKDEYYTEDDYWMEENENDPNPGDYIIDYHLWHAGTSNPYICCLEYDEMNYYLGNAQYEAKRYEPINNRVFRHIEMDCEFTTGTSSQNPSSPLTYFRWWGIGTYAKKNFDRPHVDQLGPCL